jgi:mRNA interferase RelE/StbE
MAYRLDFTTAAIRDLKRLPKDIRADVAAAIDGLTDDPRPAGFDKIEGSDDVYRIRRGDYRLLYQINDDALTVLVVRARHRREVYKHISDLLKRLQ